MEKISYSPNPVFHGPPRFPPVARSNAPAALVPEQACAGLPSLTTGEVPVVTTVGGSLVSVTPSTLTVTVAGPVANAVEANRDTAATSTRHVTPSARCRRDASMEPPLSTRACGPWSEAGLLAPGPTPPRL